jgi:hypothetical protein
MRDNHLWRDVGLSVWDASFELQQFFHHLLLPMTASVKLKFCIDKGAIHPGDLFSCVTHTQTLNFYGRTYVPLGQNVPSADGTCFGWNVNVPPRDHHY